MQALLLPIWMAVHTLPNGNITLSVVRIHTEGLTPR